MACLCVRILHMGSVLCGSMLRIVCVEVHADGQIERDWKSGWCIQTRETGVGSCGCDVEVGVAVVAAYDTSD